MAYQTIIMWAGISPLGNCEPTRKLRTPFSLVMIAASPRIPALMRAEVKSSCRRESWSSVLPSAITTRRSLLHGERKLTNPRHASLEEK
ncbi:hypothetical protein D3C72_1575340 [compost metagenome]